MLRCHKILFVCFYDIWFLTFVVRAIIVNTSTDFSFSMQLQWMGGGETHERTIKVVSIPSLLKPYYNLVWGIGWNVRHYSLKIFASTLALHGNLMREIAMSILWTNWVRSFDRFASSGSQKNFVSWQGEVFSNWIDLVLNSMVQFLAAYFYNNFMVVLNYFLSLKASVHIYCN